MKRFILFVVVCLVASVRLFAQNTTQNKISSFMELSLAQLMNMEISVASVTKLTAHESPGIVTIITRDEIKNSGASGLSEMLSSVPGFDFGMDVEGVVGLGIRGNWAHEGKVLLLIDGQEMNEELYSTLPMGMHYPVENIERIEIIRGPGSAIYGGTAAYAVINIITRSFENLKGVSVSATNSWFDNANAFRNADVYAGSKSKNFSYSINANSGSGIRSNRNYTDVYGNSYDMTNFSQIKNNFLNAGFGIKEYDVRVIYSDYTVQTRDAYEQILSRSYPTGFKSWQVGINKKYAVTNKLAITPSLNYKYQEPWKFDGESAENEYSSFRIDVKKFTTNVLGSYDATENLNIIGGVEYFTETAMQKLDGVFYSNKSTTLSFNNYSAYAQALLKTKAANFTAGCRYTKNNMYGLSFVPRIGITRAWEKFHFKALLSKAFRAPSIQNIDLNSEIKPENSTVAEIESGFQISKSMAVTINGYNIVTNKPIIYFYNEDEERDDYLNGSHSGTRGVEIDYRLKTHDGYITCNYSFYTTDSKKIIPNYEVPYNHTVMLAFPAHMASVVGCVNISKKINLYSALLFKGPRYGITGYDDVNGKTFYQKFEPVYTFNLMLNLRNVFIKNISLSAGVKNLFNANDNIIQPYNGLHAPLPGPSRQYVLKLSYNIPFK